MKNALNLNREMHEKFERDAYLHIRQPLFQNEDFVRLRNYLLSYVLALPENLRGTYFTGNPNIPRPFYADWVGAPPLINLIEQVLGHDIAFFNFALCYKPPRSAFRVGPHIDSHFWVETKCIEPSEVLIVFIPLTPIRKSEGCLRVLPGVNIDKMYKHRALDPSYNYFAWEIDDNALDLSKMKDIEMAENEVCLMKSGLVHESYANQSDEHRLGLTLRYISAKAKYTPLPNDPRKMILLQGKNIAGNQYFEKNSQEFVGGFSWS